MNNQIPRRNRLDLLTPAELAIYKAVLEVEKIGSNLLLTDAIILLNQAKNKVADFVDIVDVQHEESDKKSSHQSGSTMPFDNRIDACLK